MSNSNSILRQYQIIASLSGQMLAQARLNQWDSVIILGKQYHEAVEDLRHIDPISGADRLLRGDLLAQILSDDARIRDLATPELARLSLLLGAMRRQQSVFRTYHSSFTSNP
ncbi:MAG TPA: flagellar protein FliT [Paralcaligenes sp.]|jgi:Flagellar protein FliT.